MRKNPKSQKKILPRQIDSKRSRFLPWSSDYKGKELEERVP
jgi:hypothetical protein